MTYSNKQPLALVREIKPDPLVDALLDFGVASLDLFRYLDRAFHAGATEMGRALLDAATQAGLHYGEAQDATEDERRVHLAAVIRALEAARYRLRLLARAELVPAERLARITAQTEALLVQVEGL